jgi:spermidine synthase
MIIKMVLSFIILLVPTFFMGGTLPVLSKYVIRRTEQSGTHVGLLYSVNTLGATVGCFLSGFFFIEAFGISRTVVFAALVNLFLAFVFFLFGTMLDSAKEKEWKKGSEITLSAHAAHRKYARLILMGFALAGFVSLSYEVLWFRLLVFKLNTTVYAFAVMLTTFLAGIGLGSLIFSILERIGIIKNHYKVFGLIESFIGLLGLLSIFLFGHFESFAALWESVSWHEQIYKQLFLAGLIMIVPTLLMGMAFPVVCRIYTRNVKKIGSSIGTVYSLNTVGSIFGSLLTGFLFVEFLGTQNCIIVISMIALIVGTLILKIRPSYSYESKSSKWSSYILLSLFWVAAVVFIVRIPGDFLFRYYNIGEKMVNSKVEILYAHEGVECITTVHRYPDGNRVISTGSINVAGTDFTLRTTQKLQAHIPMLLHRNPKEVLQVGFGSGETSHILTTYEIDLIEVVEISRGVLQTSARYFQDLNHDVINHPKFRSIIMDGANYVALTDRKYDLILNDSIWPFYSGNSGLYTREYFEDCKNHLKEGGLMTSWLPVEMPEESFKTILNTFYSVFPHVSLWMAVTHDNKHALIVGSLKPLQIDIHSFLERFDQFARDDLKIVNLDNPVFFLDAFKVDETGFSEWVKSAPLHTLNRPVLEFAPRKMRPGIDRSRSYRLILRSSSSVLSLISDSKSEKAGDRDFISALMKAHESTKRVMTGIIMRKIGDDSFIREFKEAIKIEPDHPGARYLLNEYEHLRNIEFSKLESSDLNDLIRQGEILLENRIYDKAIVTFKRAAEIAPHSAIVHYNLGTIYYRQGQLDSALNELNEALLRKSRHASSYNTRGLVYFSMNKIDKAIDDFTKGIEFNPEYGHAYNNRGIAYAREGEYRDALNDFNRAIKLQPDYAEAYYNRGLLYQSGSEHLGETKEGGLKNAIEDYTNAIVADPDYANAFNNRGLIYAERGQYPLAISDFSQVIKLMPDQADSYYNRGLAYRLSGNSIKARVDFERAARLNPSYKHMVK